jgi:hypothetical protein
MKKILTLTIFLAVCMVARSQGFSFEQQSSDFSDAGLGLNLPQDDGYPIGRFAISVNPLGFLEFGPIVNAEFGLTRNLVLNTHVRFAPVGLLSRAVTDWPDKMTGFAYGGGVLYFFGENRNKPYIGILTEYQGGKDIWDEGTTYEESEDDHVFVLMFNGGYRFRFNSGFFINTGAHLGFGYNSWTWYDSYGIDKGSDVTPAGLIEVTFGFEF